MQPSLLVELGCFYGESYFGFCQALEENAIECRCYAVDTWQGDEQGGHYREEIYANVESYNRERYRSFSQLLQMTFDDALASFTDATIDLLHIDGCHSYEAVRHDFESWLPKVRPGGIVLLHDISIRSTGFGAWRFWEELRNRFTSFEFRHSAGLGVICKPGVASSSGFLSSLFSANCSERAAIARYYETCAERLHLRFANGELRQRLAQPMECALQVFCSSEQGYTEENSAIRIVEAGTWQKVVFELPEGLGTGPLRIDPADRACMVEIRRITISSESGPAVLWAWDDKQPAPLLQMAGTGRILDTEGAITILSDGIDPQLLLLSVAGPEYDFPLRLELTVRITPYVASKDGPSQARAESDRQASDAAMRNELSQVREELAAARSALDAETGRRKQIEQSYCWRATAPARFIARKILGVPN